MVFLVVLQMAPKNQPTKKRKTTASSSGVVDRPAPLPRNPDRTIYTSNKTYARFLELKKEKTWHDKIFRINPEGEYADIAAVFTERKWGNSLTLTPKSTWTFCVSFMQMPYQIVMLRKCKLHFLYHHGERKNHPLR